CGELGAVRMAPMHWGAFVLSSEPLLEPAALSVRCWADAGRPPDDLWLMKIGETRTLPTPDRTSNLTSPMLSGWVR
ncbi:hypothetical protein AB0J09_63315, partial [Nonomuraea sp. NPDC049784]